MQRQKGFLLITAVILIIVLGLLGTALVSMFIRNTKSTLQLRSIPAAGALAESGLEQARKNFTLTNFSTRQACANLSSTYVLPTSGTAIGESVTGPASNTANNPRYAYATLSTAISAASTPTTITVNDTSVFAPDGWVLIGKEVFQYSRIDNATTLGGVARAKDGTYATDHVSGVLVSQYQCYVAGIGRAPATNPLSIREYQQGMRQPLLFAVGYNGTILRFNGNTAELAWAAQASGTAANFNAISALNYHTAWAMADTTFDRLHGSNWSPFTTSVGQTLMYGVDAVSSKEVWAVGKAAGNNAVFLRWVRDASNTNTNWCWCNPSGGCPGKSITETGIKNSQKDTYAIKMYDTDGDGFADGGFAGGGNSDNAALPADKGAAVWYYTGTAWTSIERAPLNYNLPANTGLVMGLDITPNNNSTPKEVFFVGRHLASGGQLFRLRIVSGAAAWSSVINPVQELHAVSVIDTNSDGFADYGCAVGNSGMVICFNDSMTTTTTTLSGNPNLNGVLVISASDIWVVGDGGVSFHYDGTTWTSIGTTTTNKLTGIAAIYPKQTVLSAWHELIN